ncbi:unnamed protein product [Prorocentrum cordatum]|uniref:Uncharacterized protein n=1 Tax=Prorocentrum cordatum TaxID=2364126 RepID=A0ABN9V3Q7_9DINO|nr:unnamed protein product [Polarella glacialis]
MLLCLTWPHRDLLPGHTPAHPPSPEPLAEPAPVRCAQGSPWGRLWSVALGTRARREDGGPAFHHHHKLEWEGFFLLLLLLLVLLLPPTYGGGGGNQAHQKSPRQSLTWAPAPPFTERPRALGGSANGAGLVGRLGGVSASREDVRASPGDAEGPLRGREGL